MSFLPDPDADALSPAQHQLWDEFVRRHPGRLTNMKAILLQDPASFTAYMEWYSLFDRLASVVGARPVHLFSHAISDTNECLICSVFFRQILIDGGDDPDNPATTPLEDALMDFGRALARDPGAIPDELYARIEAFLPDPADRLALVSFAGQMVATNILNQAGKIPLDDVLYGYRKDGDVRTR